MQTKLAIAIALTACTESTGDSAPTVAFEITSQPVTLQPGEEATFCYYFHTPNTESIAISKWSSQMLPGSHHVILFFNDTDQPADGTLSTDNCGSPTSGAGPFIPRWIYAAQTPEYELAMPSDDGTGKPLAMVVAPRQGAYLQIHYLNSSDQPLTAPVTLDAYAYPDGTAYTETAPYVTYNSKISIPPHAVGHVETQSCPTPDGASFWMVITHAHKQAVKTEIGDGDAEVFTSTDWQHPGTRRWDAAPYFTFSSQMVTYECTYDNLGDNRDNTIVSGPSAQTDEMCIGGGYFFPAPASRFCLDGVGPF